MEFNIISPPGSEELKRLWKHAFFPDEGRVYFSREYRPENALAAVGRDGSILSMLHFSEKNITDGEGGIIPACYILGVATYEEWRNRGLAAALLEELFLRLVAKGVELCFLIPGDGTLAQFYKRFGFEQSGLLQDNPRLLIKQTAALDFDHINILYEKSCASLPHVMRNLRQWEIISEEYGILYDGKSYEVPFAGRAAERSGSPVFIKKTTGACLKWLIPNKTGFSSYINLLYN